MSEQRGSRFAAVLVEAEQITEFDGGAVPVGALENLEGHGAQDGLDCYADRLPTTSTRTSSSGSSRAIAPARLGEFLFLGTRTAA